MLLMIVDAESNGLYGEILSVAAIVLDERFTEIDRFYGERELSQIDDPDPWVKENVLPLFNQEHVFPDEAELLEDFWDFWMKYQGRVMAMADVSYPVEANLFRKCIEKNLAERSFSGPFPLLDLSTFLLAKGYNPLLERQLLIDNPMGERHNALVDVRVAGAIWKKLNQRITK